MQKFILAAFCILAFGALFAFAEQGAPQKIPVVQWEYKVMENDKLTGRTEGNEGWELVAVIPTRTEQPAVGVSGPLQVLMKEFYFKRPKQ